jgi:hypothetical protein
MHREVPLRLDQFGRTALEEQARRHRGSVDELVRTAVIYYLSDLESERAAARVPGLGRARRGEPSPLRVELSLEEAQWLALEAEARRQFVSLAQLIQHAAFYYLADLEAGRVAAQVFERSQNESA